MSVQRSDQVDVLSIQIFVSQSYAMVLWFLFAIVTLVKSSQFVFSVNLWWLSVLFSTVSAACLLCFVIHPKYWFKDKNTNYTFWLKIEFNHTRALLKYRLQQEGK